MTEKLPSQIEYGAHEQFGSIVGSFVLESMPETYMPPEAPAGFVKALVGIYLPIRGKLNDLYSSDPSGTHYVADTILEIQHDENRENREIRVYAMDAIAELENIGRFEDVTEWEHFRWMKLGFTAAQGTLAPLPHLLAA